MIRAPDQLPPLSDPNGWIIGNVLQYGYYRVNYDIANWNALCRQLQTNYKVGILHSFIAHSAFRTEGGILYGRLFAALVCLQSLSLIE